METKGIIVNTCAELEPHAVKSISNAYKTLPVYTVGQVLDLESHVHKTCDAADRDQIMGWLDDQPESSVVFLCFGSSGCLSEDQIREISKGINQSGQRILWSLRKPQEILHRNEVEGHLGDEYWSLLEEGQGLVRGMGSTG
ncbi:hypothetical protein V2J09_011814 [Rumex salicifolius]